MLTDWHNHNGGGYAAAGPLHAAQATGPHLQPQESLTRSPRRRPPAALDPGDLYGPWQTHTAGSPKACPSARAARNTNRIARSLQPSLYGSGDCRPLVPGPTRIPVDTAQCNGTTAQNWSHQ